MQEARAAEFAEILREEQELANGGSVKYATCSDGIARMVDAKWMGSVLEKLRFAEELLESVAEMEDFVNDKVLTRVVRARRQIKQALMGVNKNGVDGSFDGGVDKNEVFYRKKEERIKKGVKNVDRDSRNGGGLRVGGSGDSGDIGSCGDVRRDDERGFLDGYFCCCDSAGVGVGLGGARRAGAVATAKSLEKALKRRLII